MFNFLFYHVLPCLYFYCSPRRHSPEYGDCTETKWCVTRYTIHVTQYTFGPGTVFRRRGGDCAAVVSGNHVVNYTPHDGTVPSTETVPKPIRNS
jgi:hypothetical protein